MANGKLKNYFVYAIGEIILVVVGILIALQINNWNLQKRAAQTEISILEELETNLEIDSVSYSTSKTFLESKLASLTNLKTYLDSDLPYNDTLAQTFAMVSLMVSPTPRKPAYERLKDFGLDNLENDSIRIYALRYYGTADHYVNTADEYDFGVYFRDHVYTKHFKSFSYAYGAIPVDYEKLKNANDFRVALDYVNNDAYYFINGYRALLRSNAKLRKFIGEELERRQ